MPMEQALETRPPDLFREMRRRQREMNRLFGGLRLALRAEFPPVRVFTGTEGAVITAQMPGVAAEQIDITVDQDTVTLRGKREPEVMEGDVMVHRQERQHGPFARAVLLPFRVDGDKAAAHFQRGVLTLELPRPESDKPRHIKVSRA
jgi:HSP20 family protein